MKWKLFLYIIFFTYQFSVGQLHQSLFSADYNMGYNFSRVESNYIFEKNSPFSFQINWQKSNFYTKKDFNDFGYSDFGLSFLIHDYKDEELGKNFAFLAFMEFYLIKPTHRINLSFRLSQGIAYNTHPYNKKSNPKNYFFGSYLSLPLDLFLYFRYPKIIKNIGLEMGVGIFHYSSANLHSPNYGANIPSLNIGLNYDLRNKPQKFRRKYSVVNKKWNLFGFLRFGVNESDYINSGQYPFFIPGIQISKFLNQQHKISFGTELFLSYFLKEQIAYESIAFPEFKIKKNTDFKRLGLFSSYEFFFKKIGIDLGMGYYIYYPYHFETRYYNRILFKYYFNNTKAILGLSLKFHSFSRAEALEFFMAYKIF